MAGQNKERQCIFWIIVGTNGVGKTTFAKDIIENKYPANRSVLIADPDGYEPAWYKYPQIAIEDVQNMTNHRFRFMAPEKEDLEEFRKFKNGMLVLDDCNHYLKANLQTEMKQIFIRRRQNDIDIIAMAHHLTEVPPKFWNFASHLVLFKTGPLRKVANIPEFIRSDGHIKEVNEHPDRHFKKIIPLRG